MCPKAKRDLGYGKTHSLAQEQSRCAGYQVEDQMHINSPRSVEKSWMNLMAENILDAYWNILHWMPVRRSFVMTFPDPEWLHFKIRHVG